MKMIVMLAAFLGLAVQQAAAQTTYKVTGVAPTGYGCIGDGGHPGGFVVLVQFQNSNTPQNGKVEFIERKPYANQTTAVCADRGATTGQQIYKVLTDNNLATFKIEKFTPGSELVVSSPGYCGQTRTTIRATVAPNQLTIECTGLNYTAKGVPKPPILFK